MRKLRRRERWVAQWFNSDADHAATIRAVVTLDAEIATITRTLRGEDRTEQS